MAIPFSLDITTRGGVCQLTLAGDVDVACAEDFAARAMDAIHNPLTESLLLDLAQVTFIDSSGIGTLFRVHTCAHQSGKTMTLRAVPRHVSDVLKISGLDLVFSIQGSDTAPGG